MPGTWLWLKQLLELKENEQRSILFLSRLPELRNNQSINNLGKIVKKAL